MKKLLWSALASGLLLAASAVLAQSPLQEDARTGAIDLASLADNPPILLDADGNPEAAPQLPDVYIPDTVPSIMHEKAAATHDARTKALVPPVRFRGVWQRTDWAFAAIGAAEINAVTQRLASADEIDLSEMHMAYFAFGDTRPGHFYVNPNTGKDTLEQWLNNNLEPEAPTAFLANYGAIAESSLGFPASKTDYIPPAGLPGDYPAAFHLKEAYHVATWDIDATKQLILRHGAVTKNITWKNDSVNHSPYGLTLYSGSHSPGTNRSVILVGWDDKIPATAFRNNPRRDGAWLVRDSQGTSFGDGGYFWVSYVEDSNTLGAVYILKPANPALRHWGHDALGATHAREYPYAANVFFVPPPSDVAVQEVAFYTTDNNVRYEITVHDLGTSTTPPTVPVTKTPIAKLSGTMPYAGYHRLALPRPASVDVGHYFSVVTKLSGGKTKLISATESPASVVPGSYLWVEPEINAGESYFSEDGQTWLDGSTIATANPWLPAGNATTKAFTLPQPPTIITTTLGAAVDKPLGDGAGIPLQAKGGKPITWEKTAGNLPDGLTLSDTGSGYIKGTPSKVGTWGFTVKATNSMGSATKAIKMVIGEPPVFTTPLYKQLPTPFLGVNYSATLKADGTAPITWEATGLPPGLTMATNGRISGKPTSTGMHTVTITATNAAGKASQNVYLEVMEKPFIKMDGLDGGVVREAYEQELIAGGSPSHNPWKWFVSGKLPDGVGLVGPDASNKWFLRGTPEKEGTFSVTLKLENDYGSATKAFKIVIGTPPAITTSELPDAVVGVNYSATLKADGTKPITWEATGLPEGLKITGDRITGKPTKATKKTGTTITLTATNATGAKYKTTKSVSLRVAGKPAIKTTELPAGVVGEPYTTDKIFIAGSFTDYPWVGIEHEVKKPEWMSNFYGWGETGGYLTFSGTPTKEGTYNLTLTLKSKYGNATKTFKIVIGTPPAITTSELPDAVVGVNYSATLKADGTKPITWEATDLPEGLKITGDRITGKPTKATTSTGTTITLTATNATGAKYKATKTTRLKVVEKPSFLLDALPGGVVGELYNVYLDVRGSPSLKMSVTSKLPDGINLLSGLFGYHLDGTPEKEGTFSVTLKVENEWGSATKTFKIVIGTPPVITVPDDTLPTAVVGVNYSYTLPATGTKPITWAAASLLPEGLKITGDRITGKPAKAGSYTLTVQATNATGRIDTKPLKLRVVQKPIIYTAVTLPSGKVGSFYEQEIDWYGTDATWKVTGVPDWLERDMGVGGMGVWGTPPKAGTYSFTVKGTSAWGTVTRTFRFTVTN